jgi:predicted GH43/DUF377 family glycosyl hydrolase
MVYLLFFTHILTKFTVEETKSQFKNLVMQRCAEGFNSGVKVLTDNTTMKFRVVDPSDWYNKSEFSEFKLFVPRNGPCVHSLSVSVSVQ